MKSPKAVDVVYHGQALTLKAGTSVLDVLGQELESSASPITGAVIHNRLVGLKHRLLSSTELVPVSRSDREGFLIYFRSVCLVLAEAAHAIAPTLQLVVGQAIKGGYHIMVQNRPRDVSLEQVIDALRARMRAIVENDRPFRSWRIEIQEAEGLFEQQGGSDKVQLLQTWHSSHVPIISCGEYYDIKYGPFLPSTGHIDDFALQPYERGFVLSFSTQDPNRRRLDVEDRPKLFRTYQEAREWNRLLGVENVGQLNELCLNGGIQEIIKVVEGLHEKKVAAIADQIAQSRDVRLVLIAGPSSSGKTTFSKRLALQLRVNSLKPVALSLDNYYIDREDTPLDEDGNYDFESIEAIDLERFNQDLVGLLAGDEVMTPRFNFQSGKRVPPEKFQPMRLRDDQILIIEGIHGLNDRLTSSVPAHRKFKIYISALTQLCIDNHNRIFTSDTRLLRRIVRDRLFRGYTAADSIAIWPRVKRGELKWIYPYQESADVMFNSALIYEPAVLHVFAERFLMEIPPNHPSRIVGHRLRKFIDLFVPVFPDNVPQTSILREFIGGSGFKY
ncbi:MAG: cyclic nucleotide-binding protein [Myxococcales bacterium]|nr:cyclic nucleotide-binding protein [Myxococcales bacterium]